MFDLNTPFSWYIAHYELEKVRAIIILYQSVWCVQSKLDTLDAGARRVSPKWHDWGNVEEGGATKPSKALA